MADISKFKSLDGTTYNLKDSTARGLVVPNPTLAGTEADLTSLQVGSTKYKVAGGLPEGYIYTQDVTSAEYAAMEQAGTLDPTVLYAITDDYVDGYYTPNIGKGVNLFDNWYFIGGGSQQGGGQFPINQRGKTTYNSNVFSIDRFSIWSLSASPKLEVLSDCIKLTSDGSYSQITQNIEDYAKLDGLTLTFSILFAEEVLTSNWYYQPQGGPGYFIPSGTTFFTVTFTADSTRTIPSQLLRFVNDNSGEYCKIVAIKLELGDTQTLARQVNGEWVLNDARPNYQQELAKCQRYYVRFFTTSDHRYWSSLPGIAEDSARVYPTVSLPSVMRARPTFSYSGTLTIWDGVNNHAISSIVINTDVVPMYDTAKVEFAIVTSGLTAGATYLLQFREQADAYLEISADY